MIEGKKSFLDAVRQANNNKVQNNTPVKKAAEGKKGKPSKGFGGPTVVRRSGRGG